MHSERHYYEDSRFFEITVQSVQFRVPFALLAARCQVFKDCSDLPAPEREGSMHPGAHALSLHYLTSDEFRAFLDFLFKPHPTDRFSIPDFEAILKLSDMYDAPSGISFVKKHLPVMKVDPAHLLNLAIRWQASPWFLAAYCRLAALPLEVPAAADVDDIPPTVLAALKDTRCMVRNHRQHIIELKPEPYRSLAYSAGCSHSSKGACYRLMRDLYNTSIHPLVAGNTWYAFHRIIKAIRREVQNSGEICHNCAVYYIQSYSRPFLTEFRRTENSARTALAKSGYPDDAKYVLMPVEMRQQWL